MQVILDRTLWSPEFDNGTQLSLSGSFYSFQSVNGSWTVSLNGVSANIIRSDILVANGVIHIIDQVLFNVTAPNHGINPVTATGTNSVSSLSTTTDNLAISSFAASSSSGSSSSAAATASAKFVHLSRLTVSID